MKFFDEAITVRLRTKELVYLDILINDDPNIKNRSEFTRSALLKEMRARGYKHE